MVAAYFKVLYQYLLETTEVNHEKSVRIASLQSEVATRDLRIPCSQASPSCAQADNKSILTVLGSGAPE